MIAPLRRVMLVTVVLFGLLLGTLTWVQVFKADDYRSDPVNNRERIQQQNYERQRGQIIVDGEAIATSVTTLDSLKYLRTYPAGELYAAVTGYRPVDLAPTGVEAMEDTTLNGTDRALAGDRIFEMLTGKLATGGNVVLTIEPGVQQAAYNGLLQNPTISNAGAVVALDPTTGAILALVSTPSYDPNPLASHDADAALAAYNAAAADPAQPLVNRALQESFPAGSTFKVIDAAAALSGGASPALALTGGSSYTPPNSGTAIKNAPGVVCPSTISMLDALRVSCNTAFARYAVEDIGADRLKATAAAFGFEDVPTIRGDDRDALGVVASTTGAIANPDGSVDLAALAQSAIGQRDVRMTPLQGAMIAATIANNGTQMQPYLVDTVEDANLNPIVQTDPTVLNQAVSGDVAVELRQMMSAVVNSGTGIKAQISGYEVGGKTGTAQDGDALEHGWFIGYARKDGVPIVAVAVLLQNAGDGGSSAAAAIAGQVMSAAISAKG